MICTYSQRKTAKGGTKEPREQHETPSSQTTKKHGKPANTPIRMHLPASYSSASEIPVNST